MKSELDTIAFFKNIRKTLEAMTDADAGRLMKALFAHDDGEKVDLTDASPVVQMIFPLVAESTDRLTRKRQNKVRKPQTDRKDTANELQTDRKDTAHNHSHNHNQNHSQNHDHTSPDGEEERERELKLPKEIPLPSELNQDFVQEAFRDFREHRRKLRKPMTTKAEEMIIADLAKLAKGDAVAAVKILEQSIKNGWQGVFPLKDKPEKKPYDPKDDRKISYDQAARDIFLKEVCGL